MGPGPHNTLKQLWSQCGINTCVVVWNSCWYQNLKMEDSLTKPPATGLTPMTMRLNTAALSTRSCHALKIYYYIVPNVSICLYCYDYYLTGAKTKACNILLWNVIIVIRNSDKLFADRRCEPAVRGREVYRALAQVRHGTQAVQGESRGGRPTAADRG